MLFSISQAPPWSDMWSAISVTCVIGLIYCCSMLYKARRRFYEEKVMQGLPMPKWNPIFGHLLVMGQSYKKFRLPPDLHVPDTLADISLEFEDSDSLFYLDLWPFMNTLLIVSSPSYAVQVCQQTELAVEKPHDLVPFMYPISGGPTVFNTNGAEWKKARTILASGLGSDFVLSQTEHIVRASETYVEILRESARARETVYLDEITINYTMDISGAVILNQQLNTQPQRNSFTSAMRSTLTWNYISDLRSPLLSLGLFPRLVTWYNGRILNKYVSNILDKRYDEIRKDLAGSSQSKSAIDLVLKDYMTAHEGPAPAKLDPAFKSWAIPQLRLMFFVGHESSAPTICYTFYLLSQNPSILQKVRDEHDQVFGADISHATHLICTQPHLLNKLVYTTAVLKEVMRLFPPASGFRKGKPGVDLVDEHGHRYPTSDCRVWVLHSVLHRNPKYWPEPNKFIPERFLVGPNDLLYPVKGAWRPFEFGPRACPGQQLAMLDLQATMAMTIRTFNFKNAYTEWDQKNGILETRRYGFKGERAYQVGNSGTHPADGMPMRVFLRQ